MRKLNGSTITLLTIAATGAYAQDGAFDRLDADSDDFISAYEAEVDMHLLQQFSKLDSDADGRLSRNEFSAYSSENQ